ncbi:unnamed protein product [Danaus chrysippus]|uniref:(African queen) hypothetical protein n=1 Tax=Danaus chrysippus TaxID=151541 RepID=A0A8J2QJR8_9NEOP|nr:unnamed protein product [Danaus chrysippus]
MEDPGNLRSLDPLMSLYPVPAYYCEYLSLEFPDGSLSAAIPHWPILLTETSFKTIEVILLRFLFLVCLIHSLQCSEEEGASTESQPATTTEKSGSGSGNSLPFGSVADTLIDQLEKIANNLNPIYFINMFRKIFNNS